jgi:hypothetical protein
MPVRYDQDTKAKAIRLMREHAGDYPSEYAAITAVAWRLGMSPLRPAPPAPVPRLRRRLTGRAYRREVPESAARAVRRGAA